MPDGHDVPANRASARTVRLGIHRAFRLPVPIGCVPVLRRVLSPATRSRRSQPCRRSRQRRAYASALPIHCAGATLQCHRRSTSNAPRSDSAGGWGTLRPAQARRAGYARAPYAHTRGAQAALMPGARSHRTPHSGRRRRLGAGDESAPPRHHRTAAIKQIRSHVGGFGVPHVRVRQAQFGKLARYAALHAPGLEGAPEPVDRRLGAGVAQEPAQGRLVNLRPACGAEHKPGCCSSRNSVADFSDYF